MSLGDFLRDTVLWHRRAADVVDQSAFINGGLSVASSDNYLLTPAINGKSTITRLIDGESFHFVADHTNAGTAPTVTVGSSSAVTIQKITSSGALGALSPGDIQASGVYIIRYVASANRFVLINASAGAAGGFVEVTSTPFTLLPGYRHFPNMATLCTLNLPATVAQGVTFLVNGKGVGGWRIGQNSGQTIHSAVDTTTGTGGSVSSSARYDNVVIVCITANTDFEITSRNGSLVIV